MKKFSLSSWIEKIRLVAQRFPFVLFFLLGLAFYFFLKINNHQLETQHRLWAFFSLGISLSVALTLFLEQYEDLKVRVGLNLLSVLLLAIYIFTLPEVFLTYNYYQLIILGFVFLFSAFVVSFLKKDTDISFWEFSKTTILQLIISGIFAQVLFIGLSLAILSLKELFKIDVQTEVYQNLGVICYVLFAPIYFLANVPNKVEKMKQEFTFNKFLNILGLYILLPILSIYLVILYVYLAQIIIKWELPNGWVSLLVSVLALGGFLCMLITYPLRLNGENKAVNFLSRYFPLLIFPLLMLMSVGIFRRLGDYGLTINRCYVLILNLWLYGISIYLFISKSQHLKWIIITFAIVTFVSSVGPWSVFNVTKQSLVKEIGQLLNDSKLLKNGKVIDNYNAGIRIDSIQSKKISEDIKYICSTFGTKSIQLFFKDSIQNSNYNMINSRLGIKEKKNITSLLAPEKNNDCFYFNATLQTENQLINIDNNYKSYIRLILQNDVEQVYQGKSLIVNYINNSFIIENPNDKNFKINILLTPTLKEIIKNKKKDINFNSENLTIQGQNFKLTINDLTGFYYQKTDSITVTSLNANLFLK